MSETGWKLTMCGLLYVVALILEGVIFWGV